MDKETARHVKRGSIITFVVGAVDLRLAAAPIPISISIPIPKPQARPRLRRINDLVRVRVLLLHPLLNLRLELVYPAASNVAGRES